MFSSDNMWQIERIWTMSILIIFIPLILTIVFHKRHYLTFNLIEIQGLKRVRDSILFISSYIVLFLIGILLLVASMDISKIEYHTITEDTDMRVLFVLDVSPSMSAKDIDGHTRWDVVKNQIQYFLNNTHNKQVGIMVFAEQVSMIAPYTNDYEYLNFVLNSIQLGEYGVNTILSDAIVFAHSIYKSTPYDNNTVIVLTDGNQNSGSTTLSSTAQYLSAESHNITLLHIDSYESSTFEYHDIQTNTSISGTLAPVKNNILSSFSEQADIFYYPITTIKSIQDFMTTLIYKDTHSEYLSIEKYQVNIMNPILMGLLILLVLFLFIRIILMRVLC